MSNRMPQVGEKVPDFELPDASGQPVRLSSFRDRKNVVLYFYPKDETPGCTAEACSFRDNYEDLSAAGAEVIGVSGDSTESHKGFAAHHRLPFILLSDQGNKVRKLLAIPTTLGLIQGRVTLVIDKQGVVRLVFNSQTQARKHVEKALELLKTLPT